MKLLYICKQVKHKGSPKGRKYQIYSVLALVFLAMLCNCNTINSICRFGKRLDLRLRRKLGFGHAMPCSRSISRTLSLIDGPALEDCLKQLLLCDTEEYEVHIDGKVLRGSRSPQDRALHIVSAFVGAISATVAKEYVNPGEGEVASALMVLDWLDAPGSIVTGDSIFTQREVVEKVIEKECHFVLTVKANQPTLKYQIEKAFARDAEKIKAYREEISKGHGRIEQRQIEVIDMPWEYLNEWRHIRQICRITRDRSVKKQGVWEEKITTTYLITSLEEKDANAQKMLEINRGHWRIENRLHLVRDMAFDEDRHNLRHPKVTYVVVSVRDLLTHILAQLNQGYRAMREYFASKPYLAIRLLFET